MTKAFKNFIVAMITTVSFSAHADILSEVKKEGMKYFKPNAVISVASSCVIPQMRGLLITQNKVESYGVGIQGVYDYYYETVIVVLDEKGLRSPIEIRVLSRAETDRDGEMSDGYFSVVGVRASAGYRCIL